MHLIVCIDEHDGMSFCGKRLSSDRKLTEFILNYTHGAKLWMNAYTAKLFTGEAVIADEDFLEKAGPGEYCFVENRSLDERKVPESVTLFRWNRVYPSTLKFPRSLLADMHLDYSVDFPGNSHDKITVERYTL